MIAKLTGTLDSWGAGHAVIDVAGVGYLVESSAIMSPSTPKCWSVRGSSG
jgi:Holliday junction resolvasome RuvABC DNA-binding subunit